MSCLGLSSVGNMFLYYGKMMAPAKGPYRPCIDKVQPPRCALRRRGSLSPLLSPILTYLGRHTHKVQIIRRTRSIHRRPSCFSDFPRQYPGSATTSEENTNYPRALECLHSETTAPAAMPLQSPHQDILRTILSRDVGIVLIGRGQRSKEHPPQFSYLRTTTQVCT